MYVQTVHLCVLHTYERTYLLEPRGITMVEPQVIIAIIWCKGLVTANEYVCMYLCTYVCMYV